MIYIIHGQDNTASRNFLSDQKKTLERYDAVSSQADELRQAIKGNSLFATEQNILIENLFSKKAKNVEEIMGLINESSANIYIYDLKEITAKNLKLFPKAQVNIFSYPKNLFAFLDGIYPQNIRILSLFNSAVEGSELEIVMFMVIRQFRLMLGLKSNARIEETNRLASWQRGKLLKQADSFGLEKLKNAYHALYEIDSKSKSGRLSLPLKESIDLFLINL